MLKQNDCTKLITAATGGSLEADTGESFLIKAVFNALPLTKTDTYLTFKIDNVTVGYYRCVGKSGNHLGGASSSTIGINLMRFLIDRGLPFSLPIAEGQKLTISRPAGTGKIIVLYDRYDAGDIRADMPCGTLSKTYGFLQYLRETDLLTASGDMILDASLTPAEFPDFPAGKAVPAKVRIKLHGIAGCPCGQWVSNDHGMYTTYLKLIREREVLFDEDRVGFLFEGNNYLAQTKPYEMGKSIIGSGAEFGSSTLFSQNQPPLMFTPPLVFESGEELLVYLTWYKKGSGSMSANITDVAMILEVVRE